VLSEKPIALDANEAQALVAARTRTEQARSRAFMCAHHPQWRRARESRAQAHRRSAGDPDLLRLSPARRRQLPNKPPGGGALYDIAATRFYRPLRNSAPSRPESWAESRRRPKFGTDRLTSALIEFPGGRHLTFTAPPRSQDFQRVTIVRRGRPRRVRRSFNALIDRRCASLSIPAPISSAAASG